MFVKSYSISPAGHGKSFFSAFFKVSVDHLFDKLMFFVKKSGSSLEFWIKICTSPVCRIPTRKGIWYSMDTSPISDSPFKGIGAARRRVAQRSSASLQKSSRNHRSYVWTEALSDMVFAPAQKLPGIVKTQHKTTDCRVYHNDLSLDLFWNFCSVG